MYRLHIDAYCLSDEVRDTLAVAATDVSLVRSTMSVNMGGAAAMRLAHGESGEPTRDVVILEVGDDPEAAMANVADVFPLLAPSTSIIVMGRVNSIPFHEELMEGGVSEYVLIPFTPTGFIQKLSRIFQNDERGLAGRGRVICVFGAKGGVGTSTVAHNLSNSLQKLSGRPVSLIDLDLHFGTVSINLNQDPRSGMREALGRAAQGQLDSAMLERLYNKESEASPNLWTLASNPNMGDSSSFFGIETVQSLIDMVSTQASYVVVDTPQIWTPALANLMALAHETVIVTDHSIQSLRNTSLVIDALAPSKPQNTYQKYVLNHAGLSPLTDLAVKDFADTLGMSPAAILPWNPKVFRASSSEGKLIAQMQGTSKLTKVFDDLATSVMDNSDRNRDEEKPAAKESSGFLSGLFGKSKKAKK